MQLDRISFRNHAGEPSMSMPAVPEIIADLAAVCAEFGVRHVSDLPLDVQARFERRLEDVGAFDD